MLARLPILLFLTLPGLAVAEQPQVPSGGSPICVWEIYVTLLNHAEICKLDVGSDMHAAMEESVAGVRRFIVDNSEITEEFLDSQRVERLIRQRNNYRAALYQGDVDMCDRSANEAVSTFYQRMMTYQSPDELRAWTKRFVSVPRNPRQGGCL
jgi:hypothetical protein